jgi:calmodulin-binding transcription activator
VGQLMEKQRLARQAALVKQLECGCPDSTCADGKSCSHPMRRISAAKPESKRQDNSNQVTSTTPNVLVGSRVSVGIQT